MNLTNFNTIFELSRLKSYSKLKKRNDNNLIKYNNNLIIE